ncbi:MAG: macro domain-containing protein [Clostridia bacterium]|nr:macro domain-containing protein [Clostridia bacterium]
MPFEIIRADITQLNVDVIVNAANSQLMAGGGVCGAIFKAAGASKLQEACNKIGYCDTGDAVITNGFNLPAKYVIHAVGPIWQDGNRSEPQLLYSAYTRSLELAKEHRLESIAFPLISSGIYGFPKASALKIAVNAITDFLIDNDMLVYLVIFDKSSFDIGEKLFSGIKSYIDDNYVDEHTMARREKLAIAQLQEVHDTATRPNSFLYDAVHSLDESFSQMLLRKIDESGMTDAQCYKKANIDRKLFSKIRSDVNYRPSKQTALAFAIALELPLNETNSLLKKAGFALSHSYISDVIIEYFIKNGNYNIFEINEALFAFDQGLLGG